MLKLGFIGVGTITKAVIIGFLEKKSSFSDVKIYVAPHKNNKIIDELTSRYDCIVRLSTHQEVVSSSEKIFLCVPSQVAQKVLEDLSFESHQDLISFVAMAPKSSLEKWSKSIPQIYRAVPLPFVEKGEGRTPFYPKSNFLKEFFCALGGGIELQREEDLFLFLLGGSMMGIYYHFLGACEKILVEKGLNYQDAHNYLIAMFDNLSKIMRLENDLTFEKLEILYSTKNGTNELLSKEFQKRGGIEILKKACEITLESMHKT